MNFLVDAQLPRRLIVLLRQGGHDALHTLDLPHGNRTPDGEIAERADRDDRVVITKDADFVNSFLVSGRPRRLLVVATGNITNTELMTLFAAHLPQISNALEIHHYVELRRTSLIIHG